MPREILILLYANNKGADWPALPRSLISVFVVHSMESIYYCPTILISLGENAELSLNEPCHM